MRFPKIQTVSGQLRGAKVIWGLAQYNIFEF
jgi:hypothetical protein